MGVSLNDRVRLIENQSAAAVDDELVVVGFDKVQSYSLNPVGARVWQWIETANTPAELCDRLQGEFAVDRATCERDVVRFLEQLHREGLIEVEHSPHSSIAG